METKAKVNKSSEIEIMLSGEHNMPVYVVNFYENDIIVNAKTYNSYTLAEQASKNWASNSPPSCSTETISSGFISLPKICWQDYRINYQIKKTS